MALNNYNAALHHISIGGKGFTLVGAYTKDAQREGTVAQDFGGQTDLIGQSPSLSRWTQDDFSGGAFQYRLEKDAAMFADSLGVIPSQQARSLITVPPMIFFHGFDPTTQDFYTGAGHSDPYPHSMFTVNGQIYICWKHGIARYSHQANTWTWGNDGLSGSYSDIYYAAACYDYADSKVIVLVNETSSQRPYLQRLEPDTLDATLINGTFINSVHHVLGKLPYGLEVNDSQWIMNIGAQLYAFAPPEDMADESLDGTWSKIGRLPGHWKGSAAYNGMTYILCGDVNQDVGRTALVAFDGTAVLPICDFPFNFSGESICVYGGRVFVGGYGTNVSGANQYAELHEVTGSSVRLVRTFAPESYQSRVTYPLTISDMIVDEGLLWFGEKGKRLMAYDLTSDGFFGSAEIQDAYASTLDPYRLVSSRAHIYAWGVSGTGAPHHGLYRIAASGDTVSSYSAKVVTSDFVAEPAVDKVWSQLVTQTRYGSLTAEYSKDGGANWTSCGSPVTINDGDFYINTFDLSGIGATRHIRFRFTLPRGTSITTFSELIAFTCSFAFGTNGKKGWIISINGSEAVEGRDGSTVSQDVTLMASTIWGWLNTKQTFVDVDGSSHTVQVQQVTEQQPLVGPNVTSQSRPEAFFALTLTEV